MRTEACLHAQRRGLDVSHHLFQVEITYLVFPLQRIRCNELLRHRCGPGVIRLAGAVKGAVIAALRFRQEAFRRADHHSPKA